MRSPATLLGGALLLSSSVGHAVLLPGAGSPQWEFTRTFARCQSPACSLPPPDPDSVGGQTKETQRRLLELLAELNAPPTALSERKPSGYPKDFKDAKPRAKAVFGARLDTGVAGGSVFGINGVEPLEPHEVVFATGVRAMKAGEYPTAVTAFTQAVAAVRLYPSPHTPTFEPRMHPLPVSDAISSLAHTLSFELHMRLLPGTKSRLL